jgi:hypothetical protein
VTYELHESEVKLKEPYSTLGYKFRLIKYSSLRATRSNSLATSIKGVLPMTSKTSSAIPLKIFARGSRFIENIEVQ